MTPLEQLTEDMKTALKAGNKTALLAIRYVMAAVKNKEIDLPDHRALTQDEFLALVRNLVKSSQEAIEQYRSGGRQDLVDEETSKLVIMQQYLPSQLSEDEVRALVQRVLAENPGVAAGPLTGLVMRAANNRTDGGTVSRLIREVTAH